MRIASYIILLEHTINLSLKSLWATHHSHLNYKLGLKRKYFLVFCSAID